ncbi:MAG: OmpA family protein [Terriglobia bacterium]|jgi:outer membrane protein OmpA-like peptidoglycan-associated protein
MRLILRTAMVGLVAVMMVSLASGQTDVAGSKDYPGISRMPNTYIRDYKYSDFDSFSFTVTENNREKQQAVEGKLYYIGYKIKEGTARGSALQTIRNYQNAARSAGGQILYEYTAGINRRTTLRLRKGSAEVWIYINAYEFDYELTIVEKQLMEQQVTVDAAAMATSIADSGSVAIYGIYFDTGKSEIKPESEPALVEIAKLLTQDPALKVLIVGHTDMVAGLASNMKLSQARAQAVVSALTAKHGIAAARMTPMGVGPCAPVASNKTEDGRAKNRRVELVEIATQ